VKLWTKEEDAFVTNNYSSMKVEEVSRVLDRTVNSIRLRARFLNLPKNHKKFKVNSNFFDQYTTESCYWAGFIAADGCVYSPYNQLSFELQARDYTQLLRFSSDINFEGKIFLKERNNKGWSAQAYIRDEHLINSLKSNFNICERKSLTLTPPVLLDLEHKLSYIVGYIDGDGTIGQYKATYNGREDWLIVTLGTKAVLSFIKDTFDFIVPPKGKCASVYNIKRGGKTYEHLFGYQVRGLRAEQLLRCLLYTDCHRLYRKWSKVMEVMK
jgi:hypothetical protein